MGIQPIRSAAGHQQNSIDDDDDYFFQCVPPGYRFRPTDEELIVHYLDKKVNNQPLPRNKINDVNLYDYNPETLSRMFKGSGDKDWYFFTPRNRKYPNGGRPNRKAGNGFWKATGADKSIKNSQGTRVGCRKALVYYVGKPPKGNKKTSWIMHEYRVINSPECDRSVDSMRLDDWVLCRVYKKLDRVNNNTKNPSLDNNVNTPGSIEDENNIEEDEKNKENVVMDSDPVDMHHSGIENYNNFETPPYPGIIDPAAYLNQPYMYNELSPHYANANHHHHFGSSWLHTYYEQNHNIMKVLNHGKEHYYGLTHNNSYLQNLHFGSNFPAPNPANAGLEVHNPYLENIQAPTEPCIKENDDSTIEGQSDQDDIDQYLSSLE